MPSKLSELQLVFYHANSEQDLFHGSQLHFSMPDAQRRQRGEVESGSQYGYLLLSVVMISNLMAIVLQALSLKLGVVTGRDLAQACREYFSKPVGFGLWILAEIAISATDLAEVVGSAVALQLLFGIPLIIGVLITALDVFMILFLNTKGFRSIEAVVGALIVVIGDLNPFRGYFSHDRPPESYRWSCSPATNTRWVNL